MVRFSERLRLGASSGLFILIVLGIMVFIALISLKHPKRIDLTSNKEYTLSPKTIKILKNLKNEITIKAFFQEGDSGKDKARDLFDTYRYYSRKIKYEFIDPDRKPAIAKEYKVRSYGTIVLEGNKRSQTIFLADEEHLTNAILKLISKKIKEVRFTIGHGEKDIENSGRNGYSTLKEAITKENYPVKEINLATIKEIPKEVKIIVIAGPQKPFFKEEIELLDKFINSGGRVIVMLEPFKDAGLKEFLKKYGLKISDDIVIDKLSRLFGGDYLIPMVTHYGVHIITQDFKVATFFPTARSVEKVSKIPKDIDVTLLALTSENAWAETDRDLLNKGKAGYDKGEDKKGPIAIAAISKILLDQNQKKSSKQQDDKKTKENKKTIKPKPIKAYLTFFGDSDFVNNVNFHLSGNGDLFINTINYLSEEENRIAIGPKKKETQPLLLSRRQGQIIFFVPIVVIPGLVLLGGILVFIRRRKNR